MTDGHCFISYSNAESEKDTIKFAFTLADKLKAGPPSIDIWIDDRSLHVGDWDEQVSNAIKKCKCFLFLVSLDSVAEGSICTDEWNWAIKYKKPIIPLILQKGVEVPFRLSRRNFIDFTGNFDTALSKLRNHIDWLDSPEGFLQSLRDRLGDAQRDLRRNPENPEQIQSEIDDLRTEIRANEFAKNEPKKAQKQTRDHINAGLERDRQPINPSNGTNISKFINSRPGTIPDYFEGRLIETQGIADFLRNDHQRIMTIIGRAGSGKTVLTCRVLQRLENGEFPNDLGHFEVGGIVYLSEIGNHKINVPNIFSGLLQLLPFDKANKIDAIYREPKKPVDEKICALLAELPQEPVILLLDNFEDLLDSENEAIIDQELYTTLVTILQADKHHLKILITTRVVPRQISLIETARQNIRHLEEGLSSPYAENVLRKMDVDGQASLRDATDELLGKVREATLGYPRALESLYAILRIDRYSSVEELLVEGLPETVVEKFVGEAFSRLDITKQKIIQALAIYNRPVSYAAIDFVLQLHIPGINSASILERLVSMHFVRREAKRYFLHPADREYAISRMPSGDLNKKIGQGARARKWDQHSLTLRAADYFTEVRKPRTEWKKLDDLSAQLAEFDLRCAAGDYDTATSILIELDSDYLSLWGHNHLIIDIHEKLRGKIKDPQLKMFSLMSFSNAKAYAGNTQIAIVIGEEALSIAREIKDRANEGVILGDLGNRYFSMGNFNKSMKLHEEGLAISREFSDKKNEANWLGNLGNNHSALGDLLKAINFYEQALAIAHQTGDKEGENSWLSNLGACYSNLGQIIKATEYFEKSLVIAREIGDRDGEKGCLINLGIIYYEIDDHKAIIYFQQALVIAQEISDRRGESNCLVSIATFYLSIEELERAKETYSQAMQIADEISFPYLQMNARLGFAKSYLFQNVLADARAATEVALGYDVPVNNHYASALHGIIALRQGDEVAARGAFVRAIGQADEILSKTAEYYDALDAKGLALCGLILCRGAVSAPNDDGANTGRGDPAPTVDDAIETFRKARKIAPHAGVVKSILRLFDELVKCEGGEILKDVRKAVEGV